MRNWEEKNNQSIYKWVRTQEDFYDELLLISSTSNENILFKGLNHQMKRFVIGQDRAFKSGQKFKKGHYQSFTPKSSMIPLSMLVLVRSGITET